MECHLDLKKNLRDRISLRTLETTVQPQESQSPPLQEKLKTEKPRVSYADLHDAITKNVKGVQPRTSWSKQKQQIYIQGTKEEELVKYMTSVPGYLERKEKPREKVLNFGVLDWRLLEKWQYSQKQMPCSRSTRCSPSSSYSSSYFSTDGPSIDSNRRHSCSPARERMRRLSLQYHLMASPGGGHFSGARSSMESAGKFQDPKAAQSDIVNGRFKFVRTDQPFSKNHEVKPGQHKNKVSHPNISREIRALPKKVNYEVVSSPKGKTRTQYAVFARRAEKLQEYESNSVGQDVPERQKAVVLLLPRDRPQNNQSGVSPVSSQTNVVGQRLAEASRVSFSEISKEAYRVELMSGVPHSCPLPRDINSNELSPLEHPAGSLDAEIIKFPPSAQRGVSPSRGKNLRETNSTITRPIAMEREPSKELNMKASKAAAEQASKGTKLKASEASAEKPRSTSPFRRLSIGMAKISKSSGHKEGLTSAPHEPSSKSVSAKSGSENNVVSSSLDRSSDGKPNSTGKARSSSPLRRLLDPLMKPKAATEPSQKDSMSRTSARRSLTYSSTEQLGKGKLDSNAYKGTDMNNLCQGKKHGSSTFQALLRVAVKNGLPLFTFAVDNNNDIFAATLKVSTSRKDEHSCIYTFFTIREVKKKSGSWIIPGGKGKGHDFIPDVVAQMRVFDAHSSNSTGLNSADQFRMKEFVLFSVDLGEEDQGTSNFQPNNELAAIVVTMPNKMHRNSTGHNRPLVSTNQEGIRTTVILPSGTHSLPSNGEPSSLVQRWRSGGSCDCGGWDLGCKLKILANSNQQLTKKSSSSLNKDHFKLFSQEGAEENQLALSLAPFKDGIFSVEFNSSLSFVQAFSTCIAILDSRRSCEFPESSYMFEGKASEGTVLVQPNDGNRIVINQVEGEVPAKYVSYPPLSPVGRV